MRELVVILDEMSSFSSKLYKHHKPLRDIVAEEIRSRIFSGSFLPGARLVERDLAGLFSVSRLPVREALRILLNEGLVENLPSRGMIVRTFDKREILELFDIREALEALAASQSTQRAGKAGLDKLEELVDGAREAVARGDLNSAHLANSQFHDEIISLSGNALLHDMLEPLLGRLHWLFRQIPDFEEVCVEHDVLRKAIASGDPEIAASTARSHVGYYRTRTIEYLFGER